MRVLLVHPQMRNYRLKIFEKLNQRYDVIFIFIKPHPENMRIPSNWNYKILINDNKYKLLSFWRIKLIFEIIKNRKEFDIILTSIVDSSKSQICFILAKMLNKRFVTWDLIWYWGDSILSRFRKLISSFILRNSDSCICYGTKTRNHFLEMGVSPEKIFLNNPCVIDHSISIKHIDSKEKLHIKNKKVILYLSRIIKRKGLDILIKAFKLVEKKIDDVFLLIGGDGNFKGDCEQLAKELNIKNIYFSGKIPHNEVATYYQASNVFVLPSFFFRNPTGTYFYEAWGLVINEAMSFGLPVITTNAVGAGFDLVKNGYNGFIVKNNSVEQLFEALMKILSNPVMAKEMGKRSREIFEKFNDYDLMFKQFDEALKYACLNRFLIPKAFLNDRLSPVKQRNIADKNIEVI